MRTASLIGYAAARADVDLILFAVDGASDPVTALPPGLVRNAFAVRLPAHSKGLVARIARNAGRLLRGVPPLLDRFAGCEEAMARLLNGRQYDAAILEHFWTAPYRGLVQRYAKRVYLDLHNIESEWHERLGSNARWPASMGHRRFARMYRAREKSLLPRFDGVLVSSAREAKLTNGQRPMVYPNAIPAVPRPDRELRDDSIVFSGNMEYHPNQQAVDWFGREAWPRLRERFPSMRWRIVGKNPEGVAHLVRGLEGIELTGPVDDAIAALAESRVAIVPVISGSGTRVKILEAWAAGVPVVSTRLGAEGLEAAPGVHYRAADTAEEFVEAVAALWGQSTEGTQLAVAGRGIYEQRFTWDAAWKELDRENFLMA